MSSPSQRWPGTSLWWIVLGLGVVLVLGAVTALWHLRRVAIEDQARELGLLSRAFSDALSRGLRGVDEGLHALRLELRERRLPLSGDDAVATMRTRAELMPLVQMLWVLDGDGQVMIASHPEPAPDLRSFYPPLTSLPDDATAISRPFRDRSAGQTMVARVLRISGDRLAGPHWIVAAAPAETLRGSFAVAAPAPDARLAVFREDGVRLAGSIVTEPKLDEPSIARRLSGVSSVEWRRFSDDSVRLVSVQDIKEYRLKLVVTRDLQSVLAPWREVALLTVTVVALLLFVMVISAYLVLRADRRRAEAQEALRTELARASKLQSLGTLAGGVAHDFNNVLAGIVGFGEMAQDSAPPGSDQARYLDKLQQAALRGKALAERILTFSRGGARTSTVFELELVVDEVLTLLSASLPAGIVLERRMDALGARMRGDPTRAFEAVMNLCTNAMQAMPQGGLVRVGLERVRVESLRVLSHSQLPAGDYLAFSVSDQGSGITPEVMEHLFEPFFTTRKAQAGTGLGLAVVHGVVTEFGGAIDVQSTPGRGACFTLYFPECMQVAGAASGRAIASPAGAGQTLLVVDDDPTLVEMMGDMLRGLGYDPVCCTDPQAAVQLVRETPGRFHAAITDEVMPGLTGTELSAALRAVVPQLPILLMTGFGGTSLAARAGAAGVSRVLYKPVQRSELAHALAELLR